MKPTDDYIAEVRTLVSERVPMLRARSIGERTTLEWKLRASGEPEKLCSSWWAHLAHIGTMDKVEVVLSRDGPYETFELLAIARNLFENLVWMRLIRADLDYGLVFYARLLKEQVAGIEAQIAKIEAEAELFLAMDDIEDDNLWASLGTVLDLDPEAPEVARAREEMDARTGLLDDLVRREFCLFAEPAKFNGYAYQAHILRTHVLPDLGQQLASTKAEAVTLKSHLDSRLAPRLLNVANARAWNWKERASDVYLGRQYDFLYGYTSRLLHSTPLNIITEKALSASEMQIILDYTVIVIGDILDEIGRFTYPGQLPAIYLKTE